MNVCMGSDFLFDGIVVIISSQGYIFVFYFEELELYMAYNLY